MTKNLTIYCRIYNSTRRQSELDIPCLMVRRGIRDDTKRGTRTNLLSLIDTMKTTLGKNHSHITATNLTYHKRNKNDRNIFVVLQEIVSQ